MIRTAALAATLSLLVAGCTAAPVADNVADNTTTPQTVDNRADIAETKGWADISSQPEAVIVQAQQLGWRMPSFAKAESGFASESAPAPMMTTGATPIVSRFRISGPAKDSVETLRFALDITDEEGAAKSTTSFAKNVRAFFFLFKIDAAAVEKDIVKAQAATGLLAGTPYVIDVQPLGTTQARRITVTFTRPAPKAPAKQPQGT